MARRGGMALGGVGAALLWSSWARAETVLEWRTPSGCPGHSEVIATVEELAPGAIAEEEPSSRFVAEVTKLGDGHWRLDLKRIRVGSVASRRIEGDSCQAIANATGAAIALALRPADGVDEVWLVEQDESNEEPRTKALVTEERPHLTTTEAETEPATEAEPPPPAPHRGPVVPLVWALGGADLSTFPGTAGTAELGFGLRFARPITVEGSGALTPPQRYTVRSLAARFALYSGGLRACAHAAEGRIALGACAGAEAGVVSAEGGGENVTPRTSRVSWFAPSLTFRASWPLVTGVRLAGQGALLIPLSRHRFRIEPDPPIHELPAVSWRLLLGLEIATK